MLRRLDGTEPSPSAIGDDAEGVVIGNGIESNAIVRWHPQSRRGTSSSADSWGERVRKDILSRERSRSAAKSSPEYFPSRHMPGRTPN